jgi:uncharacterized Zn finger protein
VVAAIHAGEFVRGQSLQAYIDCRQAARKLKAWPQVRGYLLAYLEHGTLPWEQRGWPLPEPGFDMCDRTLCDRFPMIGELMDIAIHEKRPDQVLHWYDQRPEQGRGQFAPGKDTVATAIQGHAPDRAVAMWRELAEDQIAQVKPRAYEVAAGYLRKAASVMARQKKEKEWNQYLGDLKEKHARKLRLMEILDRLDGKPILKRRR